MKRKRSNDRNGVNRAANLGRRECGARNWVTAAAVNFEAVRSFKNSSATSKY
jgi:hypothetical protein